MSPADHQLITTATIVPGLSSSYIATHAKFFLVLFDNRLKIMQKMYGSLRDCYGKF